MKYSIQIRLGFGVFLAALAFTSVLRASLDEILAPLPSPQPVAAMQPPSFRPQATTSFARVETLPPRVQEITTTAAVVEEVRDAILGSDLVDSVSASLADALRPSGDLTLIPLRDLPDLTSYSRPFAVSLLSVPNRLSRGNLMLRFQVENEKGILGDWTVPFRVHLYSEVWFPRAQLRRGEMATPSDFESRRLDLLAEPDAVPATLESLLRHEYSRDLRPGKPLVWKDLMERAMIRKGDMVEVTAVSGLMAISLRAVARQDGSDGDLILLRNADSAREFSARVTGENRAEVAF